MRVTVQLRGTSPILMHNPQMIDPECPINREIGLITAKRKKTDEDRAKLEKLEWYGGIYTSTNGHGTIVTQPTAKVRKCLINAARISKQGKMVERALSFGELDVPLIYDGPKDIDELFKESRFHSRLPVGIGGKRVMRVRPKFLPWSLDVSGLFVEDAGLNFDEFEKIVELAGIVEGIGDNRVNGYGRFTGKVVAQ